MRAIHAGVRGTLRDGTPYVADDPSLLAWVHVTEATCFLRGWIRYAEPRMSVADQNRYFAEMAQVAEALGADPVPRSHAQARRLIDAMRPQARVDARTREVARMVLNQRAPDLMPNPVQAMPMQASVDLLPDWARRMHGLPNPALGVPLLRIGTLGIARPLRWAFT